MGGSYGSMRLERGKSECYILRGAERLKERETIGRRFLEAVHAVIKGVSNNFHIPLPIDAHSTCVQYTYFPSHFEKNIGIYIYITYGFRLLTCSHK